MNEFNHHNEINTTPTPEAKHEISPEIEERNKNGLEEPEKKDDASNPDTRSAKKNQADAGAADKESENTHELPEPKRELPQAAENKPDKDLARTSPLAETKEGNDHAEPPTEDQRGKLSEANDRPLKEHGDTDPKQTRIESNRHESDVDDDIAPIELIDTTNDKEHSYIDKNGNEKKWVEHQSPFVDQEDSNGKYYPDAWGQEDIPANSKLYQIGSDDGRRSPYYFDEETANRCRGKDGKIDSDAVKSALQIDDPDNTKNSVKEYWVPEDLNNVPKGHAIENPQYGEGGGKQYYLSPELQSKLEPVNDSNYKVTEDFAKNCPIEGNDGHWEGNRGDSKWIPDSEYIPQKSNPDNKTWAEILNDNKIDGVDFREGAPYFDDISKGNVEIDGFSDKRSDNFDKADIELAKQRGCKPEDVEEWRTNPEHKYTWHECPDMKTMQKVPSIVHNNISHRGGISAVKAAG